MVRRLKVCLNGDREPSEHPGVPITPPELAASARAAVTAGAEAVHVHPRGPDGTESFVAADVGAALAAIRQACPGVPVGVSTGLWVTGGDGGQRLAWITGWADLPPAQRPDYASVNLSEPGVLDLLTVLAGAGIGVEAGVWSAADAHALAGLDATIAARLGDPHGPGFGWQRILVEIVDLPSRHYSLAPAAAAVKAADRVLAALYAADEKAPLLLHGEQAATWPLVRHAGRLGLPTRIGLEDVLVGPSGERVRDNAELVRLALREWQAGAADRAGSGREHEA